MKIFTFPKPGKPAPSNARSINTPQQSQKWHKTSGLKLPIASIPHSGEEHQPQWWFAMKNNPCHFPTLASLLTSPMELLHYQILYGNYVFAVAFSSLKPTQNVFSFLEKQYWFENVVFSLTGKAAYSDARMISDP